MSVTATFLHEEGYRFNIFYQTRGGFLRAITRCKYCVLDNAVDHSDSTIITPATLNAYKKKKGPRCLQE